MSEDRHEFGIWFFGCSSQLHNFLAASHVAFVGTATEAWPKFGRTGTAVNSHSTFWNLSGHSEDSCHIGLASKFDVTYVAKRTDFVELMQFGL